MRLGQTRIRGIEQIQRPFQIAGAVADLFFQHRGAFELRPGGAAILGGFLGMADQRADDGQKLFGLPRRAVGRIDQRAGGGQIVGGGHQRASGG